MTRLMTLHDAAAELGMGYQALYKMARAGRFPVKKLSPRKFWVDMEEAARFLEGMRTVDIPEVKRPEPTTALEFWGNIDIPIPSSFV